MWPRTGAQHRQLILVSSLMARWACRACCTGQLLLQRGSLLRHRCPLPRSSVCTPFPASARAERSLARAAQQRCAGTCHPQSEQMPLLTQQMANPTAGRGSGVPISIPSYRLNSAPPFSGLGASTGLPGSPRLQTSPRTPLGAGDQPLPPAPGSLRPGPSATAPGGSIELKQKRTLILKKIIVLE